MITYVTGDATRPPAQPGTRVIAHICNDEGGWGAGFVMALSRRDKGPEVNYRTWARLGLHAEHGPFELGKVQIEAYAEPDLWVANMIAQHGYGYTDEAKVHHPPIRYIALAQCLRELDRQLRLQHLPDPITIHMPRIGCGLAGGKWDQVGPLVEKFLGAYPVVVYDPILPDITTLIGATAVCCGPNGCT